MKKPWLDPTQSKRILALAAPVILAMLTQTGVNIVDTYYLKKLPFQDASDAQAALTPSLMLLWAIGGFLSAISVGTLAMTSRRYGEDKPLDAGAIVPNALLLTAVGGVFATTLGWIFMPQMFGAIVSNPHVAELGTIYARWRFVGITSMAMTAGYKSFFDGIGKTSLHLWAAIAMNIVNAVLCWILIFGNLGAPRMGIAGAGIAGAAASWVGLLAMIAFSLSKSYRNPFKFYRFSNLAKNIQWDLLRLSVPGGLATVAVMTGFLMFTKIVSRLDASSASVIVHGVRIAANGAATTIIIEVLSATFFSCLAFGTATAALVGQSLGRQDPEMAESYAWTSVKLGAIIFSLIGGLIFAYAPQVMGVFSDAPAVIAAGTNPLRLVSALGPVIAVGMILTQALFGAGDTRYVMAVEIALHFFCLVPAAWLFGVTLNGGLVGVWCSAGLYAILLSILMVHRFAKGTWKQLQV
ncbi:MAG: MATE family efflux transporter [Deltaproteobacteria bacterium]|nr:MATE family efflux transporter [Deltaproteobacteria bacterium]